MKDKSILRTTYHLPYHSGEITFYYPDKRYGKILSGDNEELRFHHDEGESFKIGDKVLFNKYPCVHFNNQFYATNIMRAYKSKDGIHVVDDKWSHVHHGLKERLSKIIKRINCDNRYYIHETLTIHGMDGMNQCVPVTWKDTIVYAKRIGRDTYSKFVMNREPIPTNDISIFLKKTQDIYIVKSCYFGVYDMSKDYYFLDSSTGKRSSFWDDHALVFGSEPIHPETITTVCPWNGTNEQNTFKGLIKDINPEILNLGAG